MTDQSVVEAEVKALTEWLLNQYMVELALFGSTAIGEVPGTWRYELQKLNGREGK